MNILPPGMSWLLAPPPQLVNPAACNRTATPLHSMDSALNTWMNHQRAQELALVPASFRQFASTANPLPAPRPFHSRNSAFTLTPAAQAKTQAPKTPRRRQTPAAKPARTPRPPKTPALPRQQQPPIGNPIAPQSSIFPHPSLLYQYQLHQLNAALLAGQHNALQGHAINSSIAAAPTQLSPSQPPGSIPTTSLAQQLATLPAPTHLVPPQPPRASSVGALPLFQHADGVFPITVLENPAYKEQVSATTQPVTQTPLATSVSSDASNEVQLAPPTSLLQPQAALTTSPSHSDDIALTTLASDAPIQTLPTIIAISDAPNEVHLAPPNSLPQHQAALPASPSQSDDTALTIAICDAPIQTPITTIVSSDASNDLQLAPTSLLQHQAAVPLPASPSHSDTALAALASSDAPNEVAPSETLESLPSTTLNAASVANLLSHIQHLTPTTLAPEATTTEPDAIHVISAQPIAPAIIEPRSSPEFANAVSAPAAIPEVTPPLNLPLFIDCSSPGPSHRPPRPSPNSALAMLDKAQKARIRSHRNLRKFWKMQLRWRKESRKACNWSKKEEVEYKKMAKAQLDRHNERMEQADREEERARAALRLSPLSPNAPMQRLPFVLPQKLRHDRQTNLWSASSSSPLSSSGSSTNNTDQSQDPASATTSSEDASHPLGEQQSANQPRIPKLVLKRLNSAGPRTLHCSTWQIEIKREVESPEPEGSEHPEVLTAGVAIADGGGSVVQHQSEIQRESGESAGATELNGIAGKIKHEEPETDNLRPSGN